MSTHSPSSTDFQLEDAITGQDATYSRPALRLFLDRDLPHPQRGSGIHCVDVRLNRCLKQISGKITCNIGIRVQAILVYVRQGALACTGEATHPYTLPCR